MKKLRIIAFALCAVALTACTKSPYDKAVDYLDELSTAVQAATNETEYDVVYNKIVTLNSNDIMSNLNNLSQEQKQEITAKTVNLTMEALAVKAILYVMPQDITPTADDISKLTNECLQNKADVMTAPYPQVRAIVRKYYKLDE